MSSEISIVYNIVKYSIPYGDEGGRRCAIQWSDINFDEGYIMVNHGLVQRGRELVLEAPKTPSSKNAVVMTKELPAKLKEVKQEQDRWKALTDRQYNFVCSWEDGRPLRPLYVTKTFTRYVERYGFKK